MSEEKETFNVDVMPPTAQVEKLIVDPKPTKLTEVDRMALELSKSQRQVAVAEAKTALANNDKAELQYKYVVLQIYMKYNLTEADALSENGDIIYNGANAK